MNFLNVCGSFRLEAYYHQPKSIYLEDWLRFFEGNREMGPSQGSGPARILVWTGGVRVIGSVASVYLTFSYLILTIKLRSGPKETCGIFINRPLIDI